MDVCTLNFYVALLMYTHHTTQATIMAGQSKQLTIYNEWSRQSKAKW